MRGPSKTYRLLGVAVQKGHCVLCFYDKDDQERILGPHILGHKKGEEKLLAFQFGGESKSKLPPGGQWRCFFVSKIHKARMRRGNWHAHSPHLIPSSCIDDIDVERRLDK